MDGAEVVVYGLVVVVQDDEQVCVAGTGVVEALEGEAAGEGSVADEGDDLLPETLKAGRLREAEGCGNGGGGVAGAEGVVGALRPEGEAAGAAALAVGAELFPPAGEYLVRVCLMAHVEDNLVLRTVEYVMIADYEFHCAKARCQVAGVLCAAFDYVGAELRAELFQIVQAQVAEVLRRVYLVQQFVHLWVADWKGKIKKSFPLFRKNAYIGGMPQVAVCKLKLP